MPSMLSAHLRDKVEAIVALSDIGTYPFNKESYACMRYE